MPETENHTVYVTYNLTGVNFLQSEQPGRDSSSRNGMESVISAESEGTPVHRGIVEPLCSEEFIEFITHLEKGDY